jgi:NADH-ubiquinone oxidoreductase chain 6
MVLFLIYIGGVIVIFVYVTSLASNEKFILKVTTRVIVAILTTVGMGYLLNTTLPSEQILITSLSCTITKIFSQSSVVIIAGTIRYLFVVLLIVTSITAYDHSPLRPSISAYVNP